MRSGVSWPHFFVSNVVLYLKSHLRDARILYQNRENQFGGKFGKVGKSGNFAGDYEHTINPPPRIYLEKELFSIVFKGKIWKKSQKGVYLRCKKSQKGV